MKSLLFVSSIVLAVLVSAQVAGASMIAGRNWADDVADYSSKIQNHACTMMDGSTTWWLTGPPDATATQDYVGGWRGNAPNEYIIMHWDTPLADLPGDDLVIRMYSGPAASATVLASADGTTYTNIGTLGSGTPKVFRGELFDFAGQFSGGVSHVKVQRAAAGPDTGMFFDAFGSVPEPGSAMLLVIAVGSLVLCRGRRSRERAGC